MQQQKYNKNIKKFETKNSINVKNYWSNALSLHDADFLGQSLQVQIYYVWFFCILPSPLREIIFRAPFCFFILFACFWVSYFFLSILPSSGGYLDAHMLNKCVWKWER